MLDAIQCLTGSGQNRCIALGGNEFDREMMQLANSVVALCQTQIQSVLGGVVELNSYDEVFTELFSPERFDVVTRHSPHGFESAFRMAHLCQHDRETIRHLLQTKIRCLARQEL